MHQPFFRLTPSRLSLAVALLLGSAPALQAQTIDSSRPLALASQPLGAALNALSAATGIPIAFPPALVAGKNAPAVKGTLSAREALAQLLSNSGLEAQQSNGTIIIRTISETDPSQGALPRVTVRAAAEAPDELPAAYAGGQVARGSRAGLLGNKSVMDTPFNTTSYTAELMENQQAITVADVLANDPAVRTVSYGLTNAASGGEIFMIRGFSVQDSVLFDGIPGIMSGRAGPAETAERIEVLKGPNALLNGMAVGAGGSLGGSINMVPKRADDKPLTRVTTTFMSSSNVGVHVDVGRRFGEDNQWGIRVNGIYRDGETSTSGQSVNLGAATVALDYRGSKLRASLDTGYQTMNNEAPQGAAGFGLADGVAVPRPPSAKNRIAQDWEYSKSKGNYLLAKAEYDIAPDWMIYGAVGGSETRSQYLSTDTFITDNQGNATATVYYWPNWIRNQVALAGLRGSFLTGAVKHQVNLTATYLKSDVGSTSNYYGFTSFPTNIYDPAVVAPVSTAGFSSDPAKTTSMQLPSLALADTISLLDERVSVTLGARYQRVKIVNYDAVAGDTTYDRHAITPVLAAVFKPLANLSLYGNYIEGLVQGDTAPIGTTNAGQVFPPIKTKQREIGAKYDFGSFTSTISMFQIEKPSGLSVPNGDGTTTYVMNGKQRNRGVEFNSFGELTRGIRLLGGMTYTDARLTQTDSGTYNGYVAPNVSRWQVNLGSEYDLAALPGATLTARMISTSPQYLDAANTQKIPGWTRWDVGARYKTSAGNRPLVLRAAINNLWGRNYWSSSSNNWFYLGQPRTLMLSATMDF